jgi:hypothetical protein
MKNKFNTLLIASAFVTSANASTFLIEQFDSYVAGSDMNGQGGWTVSNGLGSGPAFEPVAIADSFTWDLSAGSATIGGIAPNPPGVTTMSNSTLSLPLQSASSHPTTIRFEVAYTESSDFRNPFSVSIGTDGGNLLTVSFTPGGAGFYNMNYSTSFGGGSGFLNTIDEAQPTEFTMTTWDDAGTVKYSLSNAGAPIVTGGTLTGATAGTLINNFSFIYDSTVGGGVGDGSASIDRIVVIPEPSSVLLLGLSALGLIRRKR